MKDPKWLAFIRSLPCASCLASPPCDAHHVTRIGKIPRKCDHEVIPLCHKCHMDMHDSRGKFRDWPKQRKRDWQRNLVGLYRPSRDEIRDSRVDTPDEPF